MDNKIVARELILTADERYWPVDRPALFLGEWCKLYSRRKVWQSMDAATVRHPWMDFARFEQDYRYLQELNGRVLPALAASLNRLHDTCHSDRYWKIMVGPWLATFIHVAFERWSVLSEALNKWDVGSVACPRYSATEHTPLHMSDFHDRLAGDAWNGYLYSAILKHMGVVVSNQGELMPDLPPPPPSRANWKYRLVSNALAVASRLMVRPDDRFLIATYMPMEKALLMQLRLGQFPANWQSAPPPITALDPALRQWQVNFKSNLPFENFVASILHQQVPTVFCEGYRGLLEMVDEQPWPQNPRCIFTSNSLLADELVMAFVATRVERGSPLFYGQHGGLYGVGAFSWAEEHERDIADRYLTWGWTSKPEEKIKPMGYFKRRLASRWVSPPKGSLTLVCYDYPRYTHRLDSEAMVMQAGYTENCIRFAEALEGEPQERLLVRLSARESGWEQEARWRDRMPKARVERGKQSMHALMMDSRILVYTYNSTGFLEALVSGIPFIAFWDHQVSRLRSDAYASFQELRAVGILHDSPESAALHLRNIWPDVTGWWHSEVVQTVIRQFSERYCASPSKAHAKILNLLRTRS